MKKILGDMEAILENQISGFHQYILQKPVHLTYASRSFSDILGYTQDELTNEYTDMYAKLVHPDDLRKYNEFLAKLVEPQTVTEQYRIVPKDGVIKYVKDTATSSRMEDGTIVVSSVLSDITDLMIKTEEVKLFSETVPYGCVRYTCEKNPKVTYVNDQMLKILRMQEADEDALEMYKENVFMMIPPEQRRKFNIFLKRVYTQSSPISGEIVVQRFDGTRARIHGWVTKSLDASGQEEFQTLCMDVTENYRSRREHEIEKYINALKDVYDKIFEYDFSAMTARCLYAESSSNFARTVNIPMHMEDATEHYIRSSIIEDDQQEMRGFFRKLYKQEFRDSDSQPPQIQFRGISSDGKQKMYSGIYIKMDSSVGMFCCRTAKDSEKLISENESLKNINENMQELVKKFTEGIVGFQVEDDIVKPLYASENICRFFGYSSDEWEVMAEKGETIRAFTSRCGVPYKEFSSLLVTGEAEFEYFDVNTQEQQKIRAVCTDMFTGGKGSKYVMLYKELSDDKPAPAKSEPEVHIRTFGYFDVFVGESAIAFRNKKSKELLALLVDRRGGFITSEEAISYLWEDEPVSAVTLARYRKVAMRLKNILEEYGIADIVESVDGKRRLVTEKVKCDLYDYLSCEEEFSQLFKGSYLTNYSWAEMTLGELFSS